MKLINRYTRREYAEDEVYTFSVVLCDNEIDRDFEQFSPETLEKLCEMFVGKTGISDHDAKASNQIARIYDCNVEYPQNEYNSVGQQLVRLRAMAYIPKDGNEEFIRSIDSGIKKEVSVGCSVSKRYCSVCGCDLTVDSCSHIKGKKYNTELCYHILKEPTDAYEWSFVAVPAQRGAGVTKSFNKGRSLSMEEVMKSLSSGGPVCLTSEEAALLTQKLKSLEKEALLGKKYKEELIKKAVKASSFDEKLAGIILDTAPALSTNQLEKLYDYLCEKSDTGSPVVQLGKSKGKKQLSNKQYSI